MAPPLPSSNHIVDLLDVFRIGLVNGLWDQHVVVAWADDCLLAEDTPSDAVLALALSGHRSRNDVVSALAAYIGCQQPPVAGRVVLGWLHRQYVVAAIPLEHVVRTMDWLQWHGSSTAAETAFLAGVDDEYAVAVAGHHGPVAAAVEDLSSTLAG